MPAPSPRLVADGLTYRLPDGRVLLDALSLGVGRERTALVGRNGTGKSTLVRILAGALAPTTGSVRRHARVGWLPQDAARVDDRPLAHALGIGPALEALARVEAGSVAPDDWTLVADRWDLRERAWAALARVGLPALPLDRPFARVSGGEATRVALARVLLEEPELLLLDEPTNHLDAGARRAVHRLVAGWTGGVVFVSHDRALLEVAERVVELSTLGVREYGGGWEAYRAARAAEDAAAARELDAASTELRRARREAQAVRERQQRRLARGRRARAEGGVPRIMLGIMQETSERTTSRLDARQARVVEEGAARVAEARARVEDVARIDAALPPSGLAAGELVVELRDVAWVPAPGAAPVVAGISLRIDGPARVRLRGANGSGKSTVLRMLAGTLPPTAGEVRRGAGGTPVALLDQRGGDLRDDWPVLAQFRHAHPGLDETAARLALARFRFRADDALRTVGTLSGGERLRVGLACALGVVRPPRLLLLDEPTNHLDLESVEALEAVLAGYDGALVVVSHDEAFVRALGVEAEVSL